MRTLGRWLMIGVVALLASCGTAPTSAPGTDPATQPPETETPSPADAGATAEELRLYNLIMEYRASKGLPEIPLSPSLTLVAQTHVRDLQEHYQSGNDCNFHSWSDKGDWTSCCYTPDHAEAECMWLKPQELTGYPGYGFEIAYYSSGGAEAAGALQSWQGSPPHHAVIVNDGVWEDHPWAAIGIGVYGYYACVWFGEEPDPANPE